MTSSQSEARDDFIQKLAQHTTDSQIADLTVVCCGREHKVHKLVLVLQSEYFAKLFNKQEVSLFLLPSLLRSSQLQILTN